LSYESVRHFYGEDDLDFASKVYSFYERNNWDYVIDASSKSSLDVAMEVEFIIKG
jgi:hypothetical protein